MAQWFKCPLCNYMAYYLTPSEMRPKTTIVDWSHTTFGQLLTLKKHLKGLSVCCFCNLILSNSRVSRALQSQIKSLLPARAHTISTTSFI